MENQKFDITDADLQSALRELKTYIDVSDEDLREIYRLALKHACERMALSGRPCDSCPRLAPRADGAGTAAGLKSARLKRAPQSPPRVGLPEIFWSWLGAAIGIGLCAWLSSQFFEPRDLSLFIGSFGASAVLVYAAIKSPLAQPRNLIGGHVISAFIGVAAWQLLGGTTWLAAATAVSLAIVAMLATGTVHPPGGATALIAVIGGQQVHNLGWLYPFVPVGAGALVLLAVALVVNNIPAGRSYPEYWF
ncbi:MAG: HPP family protein [Thermoleophilia bacterium]